MEGSLIGILCVLFSHAPPDTPPSRLGHEERTSMAFAESDGVKLYYETSGDPDDPTLVLISGGGAQLLSWDAQLIAALVVEGLHVVCFDNRDTGLSQRFGGRRDIDGGYELADMADDVLRVLDDLGVESAHLAGHSMGGMMAQMVAIHHPSRVRSISLLSTIPGRDPRYILHGPRDELRVPPVHVSRKRAVAFAVKSIEALPPRRYDPQVEWHREKAGKAYDRGYAPEGFARQWSALLRAPERLEQLRSVRVPALVFHGRDDELLHWQAAVDTAAALENAELQIHPEVGHLIPHELWPDLVAAISRTAQRGEEARSR